MFRNSSPADRLPNSAIYRAMCLLQEGPLLLVQALGIGSQEGRPWSTGAAHAFNAVLKERSATQSDLHSGSQRKGKLKTKKKKKHHLRLPLAQGGVGTSCRRSPPCRCTKAVTKPKHIAERWRVVFRCCMNSRFSRCHPRIRASTTHPCDFQSTRREGKFEKHVCFDRGTLREKARILQHLYECTAHVVFRGRLRWEDMRIEHFDFFRGRRLHTNQWSKLMKAATIAAALAAAGAVDDGAIISAHAGHVVYCLRL